ncbi:hypothetical protein Tco_0569026 [Tanacetum coccineum]
MYTFSPMMVANSRKHHCRVRSYTREVLVISTNLDIQKNHYPLDFRNRRGDEARIKNTWYNQGYCRDHMDPDNTSLHRIKHEIGLEMRRYEVMFIRGGRYEVAWNVRWQYEVAAAGQSEHDTCPKRVIRGCQACVSLRLSCGDPRQ